MRFKINLRIFLPTFAGTHEFREIFLPAEGVRLTAEISIHAVDWRWQVLTVFDGHVFEYHE